MITFGSPEELHKLHPEFSAHSKYVNNYNGPLFKSYELGNYQLLTSFPEANAGTRLPSEISKLIDQSKTYIGAFPPTE
jgi:hypothetical protein